jgi:hypothetical protein
MASCGTITVEEPFDPNKVSVTGCSALYTDAEMGDQIPYTINWKNDNQLRVEATFAVYANGEEMNTATETLEPESSGEVGTLLFTNDLPSPGEYNITIEVKSATKAETVEQNAGYGNIL